MHVRVFLQGKMGHLQFKDRIYFHTLDTQVLRYRLYKWQHTDNVL